MQTTETDELYSIDMHPEGLIFGTGNKNGVINLWDIRNKENISKIVSFKSEVSCLAFSPNCT
jgi:WD40 repeat protein